MADDVTLPGTGEKVDTFQQTDGSQRQKMAIGGFGNNEQDVIGALTETAPASDTASSGLNGRLQRIAQRLTAQITLWGTATDAKSTATDATSVTFMQVFKQISASAQALVTAFGSALTRGSGATDSNTQRVVIASDQVVSARTAAGALTDGFQQVDVPTDGTTAVRLGGLTETAPASDTASSGLNGRLQRIAQRITSLIALLPTALGAGGGLKVDGSGTALPVSGTVAVTGVATAANQSSELTLIGAVTETAPASDTASSGLNGRLQRIAQRITSLIALLPTALGSAGGLKIDDIFSQYESVAASTTAKMGATGAQGDYLAGVVIVPGTAAAGVVQIQDGNGTAITIFAGGGTTALADLKPFLVPLGLYATVGTSGGWNVITNANVTAIGIGKFT